MVRGLNINMKSEKMPYSEYHFLPPEQDMPNVRMQLFLKLRNNTTSQIISVASEVLIVRSDVDIEPELDKPKVKPPPENTENGNGFSKGVVWKTGSTNDSNVNPK